MYLFVCMYVCNRMASVSAGLWHHQGTIPRESLMVFYQHGAAQVSFFSSLERWILPFNPIVVNNLQDVLAGFQVSSEMFTNGAHIIMTLKPEKCHLESWVTVAGVCPEVQWLPIHPLGEVFFPSMKSQNDYVDLLMAFILRLRIMKSWNIHFVQTIPWKLFHKFLSCNCQYFEIYQSCRVSCTPSFYVPVAGMATIFELSIFCCNLKYFQLKND